MGPIKFYWAAIKLAFRHSLDHTQYLLFVVLLMVGAGSYFIPKLANWESIVTGSQAALAVLGSIVAARLLLAPYWLFKEKADALSAVNANPSRSDEMLELKRREVAALEMQNAVRTAEVWQHHEDRKRVGRYIAEQVRKLPRPWDHKS